MTTLVTEHDVRDYLVRQVLDRQPSHVREVLLDTSVLARLSEAIDEVVRHPEPADRSTSDQLIEPLTEREMEVLSLVAAGLPNRQIAENLVVVVDTVKKHVSRVLRKLSADNRTQAVARARALGILA
ncbi:MAG TPA: LuxR C-terminal-related transcriptional regulator [Chloroflexota bacterium]|jgi:LuxR family maltose regulon positive regulatory protein